MYDVIILGGGPAGVSASLYCKRANKSVLMIYSEDSGLLKAHKIDNYYEIGNGHGFRLVMSNIYTGDTESLLQLSDLVSHIFPHFCVKIRKRFIKE